MLRCDEFLREYPGDFDFLRGEPPVDHFCTITGLHVNHRQQVMVDIGTPHGIYSAETITFMKFYDSSLLYVPEIIFAEFRHLQGLDISNSGIIDLSHNTFVSAIELTRLNLSRNDIKEMIGAVFLGATSLREIDLSYNRLSRLNEHTFSGLTSLSTLDLKGNQIIDVEDNLFGDNSMLQNVNLQGNHITNIGVGAFDKLKFLTSVDLSGNQLTEVDANIFKGSDSIHSIYLSGNHLKQLHLVVRDSLRILDAERNELQTININCTDFHVGPKNGTSCESLENLRLSHNKFTNLKDVSHFVNLKELTFSYNYIGKVNISTFTKLKNLKKLDLKSTNLSGLTFGTFSQQENLKFLDISENNLGHLNLDIFLPYMYRNLEEFYVGGNNLSEISGRHKFSAFSSLRKLGLGRNLFNCSYLLQLVTVPYLHPEVDVRVLEANVSDDREHIHGIECTNQANLSKSSDTRDIMHHTLNPKDTLRQLRFHEEQLERHLLLMRCFTAFIAVLGLCIIVFKMAQFFTRNRNSLVNTISYRSTNTIRSEIDV